MVGIPIDGSCNIFGDNEAAKKSTMLTENALKKKHLYITYHQTRESVAAGIMLVFYEKSKLSHVDLSTKVLNAIDRKRIMSYICSKATNSVAYVRAKLTRNY